MDKDKQFMRCQYLCEELVDHVVGEGAEEMQRTVLADGGEWVILVKRIGDGPRGDGERDARLEEIGINWLRN